MSCWEKRNVEWWEIVINCSRCGQMIPRDIWVVAEAGERRLFCNEECERLYHEYWLPKHGKGQETHAIS